MEGWKKLTMKVGGLAGVWGFVQVVKLICEFQMLIELSVSVTKKFVNFEYGLWVGLWTGGWNLLKKKLG